MAMHKQTLVIRPEYRRDLPWITDAVERINELGQMLEKNNSTDQPSQEFMKKVNEAVEAERKYRNTQKTKKLRDDYSAMIQNYQKVINDDVLSDIHGLKLMKAAHDALLNFQQDFYKLTFLR